MGDFNKIFDKVKDFGVFVTCLSCSEEEDLEIYIENSFDKFAMDQY